METSGFLLLVCYFELFWGSHREHGRGPGLRGFARSVLTRVTALGHQRLKQGWLTYSCEYLARNYGSWGVYRQADNVDPGGDSARVQEVNNIASRLGASASPGRSYITVPWGYRRSSWSRATRACPCPRGRQLARCQGEKLCKFSLEALGALLKLKT